MIILRPWAVAPVAAQGCAGDCDASATVSVDELVEGVDIALGHAAQSQCAAFDVNDDGRLTIDELLQGVNRAVGSCPLQGDAAVRAAARAALTTADAIQILDFGFVGSTGTSAALRARRALVAGSGTACPVSCNPDQCQSTCVINGANSILTQTFRNCRETDSATGTVMTRTGTSVLTVGAVSFCATSMIPPGVAATLRLTNSTIDFSCAHDCPSELQDAQLTAGDLTLTVQPDDAAATLDRALVGTLDVSNLLTGEAFAQMSPASGGFVVTTSTAMGGAAQNGMTAPLAINGGLSVDCLGSVEFGTKEPLQVASGAKCPGQGTFQVEFPGRLNGTTADAGEPLVAVSAAPLTPSNQPMTIDAASVVASAPRKTARDAVFRAAGGSVYQVLQNVSVPANDSSDPTGAKDIRITTVVGSTTDLALCINASTGGTAEVFDATSSNAFDLNRVSKSPIIGDATPPCFNPNARNGNGVVCIGPGCDPSCACANGAACETFTKNTGSALTATTDIPPAVLASASRCAPQAPAIGSTYSFGTSAPTIRAEHCAPEPTDGILLAGASTTFADGKDGTTLVLAYDVPFGTRFLTGFAGFPISRDTNNSAGCGANQVLAPGVANFRLKDPPEVSFSPAGVMFDLKIDKIAPDMAPSCLDPSLLQCVPVPLASPTPNPECAVTDLGSLTGALGSTSGRADLAGGASCGGGGDLAPDFAYSYTPPSTGVYAIDTKDSSFDTVLYVRDGSCTGAELACNDDIDADTPQSQVVVSLTQGQPVVIVVDGFGTQSGSFALHIARRTGNTPTPTVTPTPPPVLPDLAVVEVSGPASAQATAGDTIDVSAMVMNQGEADAGPFQLEFVFSQDSVIGGLSDPDDTRTGIGCAFPSLAAGASAQCSGPIMIPSSLSTGTYFLGAYADLSSQVVETRRDNNGLAATPSIVINAAPTATPTGTPTVTRTGAATATATSSRNATVVPTATDTAAQTAIPTGTPTRTSTRTATPTLGPPRALSPRLLAVQPSGGLAMLTVTIAQAAATPVIVALSIADPSVASVAPSVIIPIGHLSAPVTVQGNQLGTTIVTATGPGTAMASIYVAAPFTGTGTFVASAVSVDVPAIATPTPTPLAISALVLAPAVGVQVPAAVTPTPTANMIVTGVNAAPVAIQIPAVPTPTPTLSPLTLQVGALPVAVQVPPLPPVRPTPMSITAGILAPPVGVEIQQ